MSIFFSLLLLLLLLLSFPFHACAARTYGVHHNHTSKQLLHHQINKENDKFKPARVSEHKAKSIMNGKQNNDDELTRAIDQLKVSRAKTSEEASSVGWRVPQKKGGEAEAGFNLQDYLPPRTHPPVHN